MNMKNYTKIPNEVLDESTLSIPARYLFCVLLKYCGKNEWCFPSQTTLARVLSRSDKQIRNILRELITVGIIDKKRRGFNRSNTYKVSKDLVADRKPISDNLPLKTDKKRKQTSVHIGSAFPLHQGNELPPKSTYIKEKGKRSFKGLEVLRNKMVEIGLKSKTSLVIEKKNSFSNTGNIKELLIRKTKKIDFMRNAEDFKDSNTNHNLNS